MLPQLYFKRRGWLEGAPGALPCVVNVASKRNRKVSQIAFTLTPKAQLLGRG